MIDRPTLIGLLRAASVAGRPDFAAAAATDWLATWPGDAEVSLQLSRVEIELGHRELAAERLGSLIVADPEFADAYDLLASALRAGGDPVRARVLAACAQALRGAALDPAAAPAWTLALAGAIAALSRGDPAAASQFAREALTADPDLPLPCLIAARAQLAVGDRQAAFALARSGYERWPECVMFRVLHAMALLERGETERAVAGLHQAAAGDPTGRVVERLLGKDHPYRSLWPADLRARLSRPVPAEVAAVLGDNRLAGAPGGAQGTGATHAAPVGSEAVTAVYMHVAVPKMPPAPEAAPSGETADDLPVPEPWEAFRGPDSGDGHSTPKNRDIENLADIRQEFDRIAARVKARRVAHDEDGRVPAYIVLSSRTRAAQAWGDDRFGRVDNAVLSLVEAVRRKRGWTAYRVYCDDPSTLLPFGLTPADPGNPWQIKLRLADLDRALARRAEMIGAVLIVGGGRIVPFHLLPNPTDDDDSVVPSDNPYSTIDENYFVPEWPVGRLPSDDDPDLLVRLLQAAADDHLEAAAPSGPVSQLRRWLQACLAGFFGLQARALGYTASIWRRSSLAVYRTIGEPRSMVTSPPAQADALPPQVVRPVSLSYFNLHGVEDAPEWFGQRDPLRDPEAPVEFPVALRPQDVVNGGRAPRLVYTEACYGANTAGKTADTALCLKFLDSGTRAFVGSTKVSYGSVTPPLIGADLLGRLFWEGVGQSLPVGEALRRAKLGLASEMLRRQGYLDGEDQKTLISFVLYGDPLHAGDATGAPQSRKEVIRRVTRPAQVKTACALGASDGEPGLDSATSDKVRTIVAHYLPGMAGAHARVHAQHCGCEGTDHVCPSRQLGVKTAGSDTVVVTLSKQVPDGSRLHAHYARLTLDSRGKVLKLAVSR